MAPAAAAVAAAAAAAAVTAAASTALPTGFLAPAALLRQAQPYRRLLGVLLRPSCVSLAVSNPYLSLAEPAGVRGAGEWGRWADTDDTAWNAGALARHRESACHALLLILCCRKNHACMTQHRRSACTTLAPHQAVRCCSCRLLCVPGKGPSLTRGIPFTPQAVLLRAGRVPARTLLRLLAPHGDQLTGVVIGGSRGAQRRPPRHIQRAHHVPTAVSRAPCQARDTPVRTAAPACLSVV